MKFILTHFVFSENLNNKFFVNSYIFPFQKSRIVLQWQHKPHYLKGAQIMSKKFGKFLLATAAIGTVAAAAYYFLKKKNAENIMKDI